MPRMEFYAMAHFGFEAIFGTKAICYNIISNVMECRDRLNLTLVSLANLAKHNNQII